MERSAPRNGDSPPARFGDHPLWLLALLGLLAWQGWLTLGLFGGERPLDRLRDDQPILAGRHPLHLYHGYLGARSLYERGSLSCYDPSFHAGYLKTPHFDSGSRPAELVLALAGGRYCPAAYKVGLAVLCAAVPLLVYTAARGVGMGRGPACAACLLGVLVWWGQPCREALEAGDVDVLLAALLVLAQVGMLIRFHRDPGPLSWLGLVGTALLGWFAHPVLLVLLSPLFLVYYLSVGTRHPLPWHVALLGGLLAAVAANAFWLIDWVSYWWIRVPPRLEALPLAHRTFRTVWEAPLWGGPIDRGLGCGLLAAAAAGVLLFNECCQRATARLLGLGWAGFLTLAVVGLIWEPLGRFGTHRLLVPALLFAALPAAHALAEGLRLACRPRGMRWVVIVLAGAGAAGLWWSAPPLLAEWAERLRGGPPLPLGLDGDQTALVETLRTHTTPQARILWEDQYGGRGVARWTALLPLLTERAYIGGLDPEASIEHTANGLVDQVLGGRPIRDWSDGQLHDYCERYNIGWVVCWSEAARERFRHWEGAEQTATLPPWTAGGGPGCLFTVRRTPSFALLGSARWLAADTQRIVLADVVPYRSDAHEKTGQILLSLHYEAGMRVAPSRVRIEGALLQGAKLQFASDSRPFVRLLVEEPVTRITITWDKR